jgi:hypothetical protein
LPVNLQLHVLRGDLCNRRSDCYGSVRESPPEHAGKIDRMGNVTVQTYGLRSQGHALSVNGAHATALNNIDHLDRRGLVEIQKRSRVRRRHQFPVTRIATVREGLAYCRQPRPPTIRRSASWQPRDVERKARQLRVL